MNFKSLVRTVPDFPRPGIMFRDITPLLASGTGFRHVIGMLAERYAGKVDKVVGIEARGFIFGAALAHHIGAGFVPVRKPGKLPAASIGHEYELEYPKGTCSPGGSLAYGKNRVELHVDGLAKGERVIVVDDLLATGGTALAALALVAQIEARVVECAFVIELLDLPGRARLEERGVAVHALCGFHESDS